MRRRGLPARRNRQPLRRGSLSAAACAQGSKMFFDCHVCASNPEALVDALAAAGADQLSFHPSAAKDGPALVARIHALGMRPGVALTPDEPASAADALIAAGAKCVTVLTVTPGFGGQKMQARRLRRSLAWGRRHAPRCCAGRRLEAPLSAHVLSCRRRGWTRSALSEQLTRIWTSPATGAPPTGAAPGDGLASTEAGGAARPCRGVNMETAAMAVSAGANVLVAGTAVFGAADPQAAVSAVRAAGAKGLAVVA